MANARKFAGKTNIGEDAIQYELQWKRSRKIALVG